MKFFTFITTILLIFSSINLSGEQMKLIEPIPKPQVMMPADGKFYFNKDTKLYFDMFSEQSKFFESELENEIQSAFNQKINLNSTTSKPSKNFIYFGSLSDNEYAWQFKEIIREKELLDKKEGYLLSVEKIELQF